MLSEVQREVSVLCLLYKIYHRENSPMHECLHHFVVARNIIASATEVQLALVILRCRTDQFNRLFLPAAVCPWNLLPSLRLVVAL